MLKSISGKGLIFLPKVPQTTPLYKESLSQTKWAILPKRCDSGPRNHENHWPYHILHSSKPAGQIEKKNRFTNAQYHVWMGMILQDWFHTNQWPLHADSFQTGKRNQVMEVGVAFFRRTPSTFCHCNSMLSLQAWQLYILCLEKMLPERNTVLSPIKFYYVATTWSF